MKTKNESMYWAAITNTGIESIINSDLTTIQIKLFLLLVTDFMDKETNTFVHSTTDIANQLNSENTFKISKPALYSALNKLQEEQLITPLPNTKGYMINPFIIYYGKSRNLTEKLVEFEKITNLKFIDDISNPLQNSKFKISPQLFDKISGYHEIND